MGDMRRAMAIRFEGLPGGQAATRAINGIAVDFRTVYDNERSAILALPGDADAVRERLESAGFLITGSDAVNLTEEESWFLSDDLDGVEALGEEDDLLDALGDMDMGFGEGGPGF